MGQVLAWARVGVKAPGQHCLPTQHRGTWAWASPLQSLPLLSQCSPGGCANSPAVAPGCRLCSPSPQKLHFCSIRKRWSPEKPWSRQGASTSLWGARRALWKSSLPPVAPTVAAIPLPTQSPRLGQGRLRRPQSLSPYGRSQPPLPPLLARSVAGGPTAPVWSSSHARQMRCEACHRPLQALGCMLALRDIGGRGQHLLGEPEHFHSLHCLRMMEAYSTGSEYSRLGSCSAMRSQP